MSFWERFRRPAPGKAPEESAGPHLSEYVSFGPGHEECKVVFLDPARGIRRAIVDADGVIRHFPGFDKSDPHLKALGELPPPRVRYRTDFERLPDGRHRVLWQVEPDGRYWADEDGFGMTNDEEITLYSFLDGGGRFTAPFRVYRVGLKTYYDPDPSTVKREDLPAALRPALEHIAEAVHDTWAAGRLAEGWRYGPRHDDTARTHPGLVPYAQLPESEKLYDRRTAAQTIQCLLDLGYRLEKP